MKVKIGFLGVAHPHARPHFRTLELLDEVSGIVAWDEDGEALERLRREDHPKLEPGRTTFDRIMEREDIPIVVSLATNDRNPEWVIRAAKAGKHVLTEKPVAASSADMAPLLDAVRGAGVRLGVYYTWRSHPIVNDLRALIDAGVIGKLLSVEGRMVTSQVRFRDPSHWLFRKRIAGGGILSWLGCHWIDAIRYITRDEVAAVTAMVDTLNEQPIDVEDTAGVIMRMGSGAIATLHAGYLLPISQAGYLSGSYDTYLGFRGLEGNITWYPTDEDRPIVVESTSKAWNATPRRELKYVVAESEAYGGRYGQDFVGRFIASAIGDGQSAGTVSPDGPDGPDDLVSPGSSGSSGVPQAPYDDGENALRVLRIIEAAYRSSETGRMVSLEQDREG
ncbi:MAG: Gfo/Idh/MocA family oxidoreductase [Gemmatimonadota bacterium]|nr:Gfo/Idh/MocA family oxidoreductase [Gemmatimonadota bacterium]